MTIFLRSIKSTFQDKRVFWQLLLPYLTVLIGIIIFGVILQKLSVEHLKEREIAHSEALLDQLSLVVDGLRDEINVFAAHLASHDIIRRFDNEDFSDNMALLAELAELKRDNLIFPLAWRDPFVADYSVINRKHAVIFTPDIYLPLETYYSYHNYEPGIPYTKWVDSLFQKNRTYGFDDPIELVWNVTTNEMKSVIPYRRNIGSKNNPRGVITIYLDYHKIKDLLDKYFAAGRGDIMILRRDGGLFGFFSPVGDSLGKTPEVLIEDHSDDFQIELISTRTGWRYISFMKYDLLRTQTAYIRKISLIAIFAWTALIMIIALTWAKSMSLPFQKVEEALAKELSFFKVKKPEIRGIREELSGLVDINQRLIDRVQDQATFIRMAMVRRLLTGVISTEKEKENLLSVLGLSADAVTSSIALIIRTENSNALFNALPLTGAIRSELTMLGKADKMGIRVISVDIGDDFIVILIDEIPGKNNFPERLEMLVDKIVSLIGMETDESFKIALGGVRNNIASLSESYREARDLLSTSENYHDTKICFWDKETFRGELFTYDTETERRLVNLTRSGRTSELSEALEDIRRANFDEKYLSESMNTMLVSRMTSTLVCLSNEYGSDSEIGKRISERVSTPPALSGEEAWKDLAAFFLDMVKQYESGQHNRRDVLKKDISQKIFEQCGDMGLNVDSLSAEFDFSNSYFPRLFRELFNISFSKYLENLRIKKSMDLIKENPGQSLKVIAGEAGFSSLTTFGRTFRRQTGESPSEYRQKNS